jgi:hypothetical protein
MHLPEEDEKNCACLQETCGDLFTQMCDEMNFRVMPTRRHFGETIELALERLVQYVVKGNAKSWGRLHKHLKWMTCTQVNENRGRDSLVFRSRTLYGQLIDEVVEKICRKDASRDRQFLSTLIRAHACNLYHLFVLFIFDKNKPVNLLQLAVELSQRYNNPKCVDELESVDR